MTRLAGLAIPARAVWFVGAKVNHRWPHDGGERCAVRVPLSIRRNFFRDSAASYGEGRCMEAFHLPVDERCLSNATAPRGADGGSSSNACWGGRYVSRHRTCVPRLSCLVGHDAACSPGGGGGRRHRKGAAMSCRVVCMLLVTPFH